MNHFHKRVSLGEERRERMPLQSVIPWRRRFDSLVFWPHIPSIVKRTDWMMFIPPLLISWVREGVYFKEGEEWKWSNPPWKCVFAAIVTISKRSRSCAGVRSAQIQDRSNVRVNPCTANHRRKIDMAFVSEILTFRPHQHCHELSSLNCYFNGIWTFSLRSV